MSLVVNKKILSNGLTVLILPRNHIPKVSMQILYNVGSKDEGSGIWDSENNQWVSQKGIAHLIEHMIFKGTDSMSESDINTLVYKLSGTCNAFTSHDYTGYSFDVPSQNWDKVLPVMADCMKNCTFKQELLNSELKAVVQEIKMYNDDYVSTLIEKMMSSVFSDHPYRNPVIGYKKNLWNLKTEHLKSFYSKHYVPNNAVLVVVGDIEVEDSFAKIEASFGSLQKDNNYRKEVFYHNTDISQQNVTIHRDVSQPILLFSWVIPGSKKKKDYLFDLISWVIGAGKGAVLYNKLVTDMGIATEVQSFNYDFHDHGMFFIYVQPNNIKDKDKIKKIILDTIIYYQKNLVTDAELLRAKKKTEMDFLRLHESNEKQAYLIGKTFLSTGDESYLLNYCDHPTKTIKADICKLFERYFIPSLMHSGEILPLSEEDKAFALSLQQCEDKNDTDRLSNLVRNNAVEEAIYAGEIEINDPKKFNYPKPKKVTLSNGLKVLSHDKPGSQKIDIIIDLEAKHFYDPVNKQGLSMIMNDLLQEGTKNYTAQELAFELESHGMELNTFPGQIGMTMLASDFKKGLEILREVLLYPKFNLKEIDRIKNQALTELKMFWDNPKQFSGQLLREEIYKGHPFSQNIMGTQEGIKNITRNDIIKAHKKYIIPEGARFSIVGDIGAYDLKAILEDIFSLWRGSKLQVKKMPKLSSIKSKSIDYTINRDQVVLCYGGLSVDRFSKYYDTLLIFDQIFTGGVLGGMNSRLFSIREQTGLFYAIHGSLLAGVTREPGVIFIKALVSCDRLEEAEDIIEKTIDDCVDSIGKQELYEAQQALVNSMVDSFANNKQTAAAFIVLDKYGMPDNYFDIRQKQLCSITLKDIKSVVPKYLNSKKMIKLRVGRI
jgi:zinc protease